MSPDPLLIPVLMLMVLGILGTVLPVLPGALLSLGAVYLYAWVHSFVVPTPLALVVLTLLGTLSLVVDYFGGALAARAGGASPRSAVVGGVVGVFLLFVMGPLGLLLGLCATVFLLEYRRGQSPRESLRSTLYALAGLLASTVFQVVLTSSMLVVFLVSVLSSG